MKVTTHKYCLSSSNETDDGGDDEISVHSKLESLNYDKLETKISLRSNNPIDFPHLKEKVIFKQVNKLTGSESFQQHPHHEAKINISKGMNTNCLF